jgi:hypothetical protein
MKMLKQVVLFMFSVFFVLACNQDPIFYEISLEVSPIPPRVSGAPTSIVQVGNTMYVASKRGTVIYQYSEAGAWSTLSSSPGGGVLELAATDGALYALCGEPMAARLMRYKGGSWTEIAGAAKVQSIYGAGTYLFAGDVTLSSSSIPALTATILYVDETGLSLTSLASSGGQLLSGAAELGGTYYLATSGSGLFKTDWTAGAVAVDTSDHNNLVGIKNVGGTIVALARKGYGESDYILHNRSGSFEAVLTGVKFTGAIAMYQKGEVNLLLLGIQVSSTSTIHGYREIVLGAGGAFPTTVGLQTPGATATSSVTDEDQYTVTVGAQPLSSIFQAKDGTPFASTIQNGLWSYREHDGKPYWNSEG